MKGEIFQEYRSSSGFDNKSQIQDRIEMNIQCMYNISIHNIPWTIFNVPVLSPLKDLRDILRAITEAVVLKRKSILLFRIRSYRLRTGSDPDSLFPLRHR